MLSAVARHVAASCAYAAAGLNRLVHWRHRLVGTPERRVAAPLHVLVVDDDEISLRQTEEFLKAAGYRVSTRLAAVGTAAVVLELRPDIILLDVLMPGLRGDDLARLLKRHPATQGFPVILYSSLPGDQLRTLIMTIGVLGALEKTSNQTLFALAFNALANKVRPAPRAAESNATDTAPATSGTFRVADKGGATAGTVGPPLAPAAVKKR